MGDYKSLGQLLDSLLNDTSKAKDLSEAIRNSTNDSLSYDIQGDGNMTRNLILLISYGFLVLIALFGNILVCHVILNRRSMRTVTNIFILNLAISDLLLVVLNVPFNIAKTLMSEWLFGSVLCHLMNMSLITSVYASTFTLTVIALDRQSVLLYPLRPRILRSGGMIVVAVIWLVSIGLSLPFGMYSRTMELDLYVETPVRCRSVYPSETFEQYLTVVTIVLQYILPLLIIGITYGRIVRRIWERTDLGAVTEYQHATRSKHKKKSIKMLMIVVIVFAICWMPLNLYHMLTDLHPDTETFRYDNTTFFVLHWVAISSACYNPFIYCWLNEAFRTEITAVFRCCFKGGKGIHPRDLNLGESVSQSELSSNMRSKGILYRRGKPFLDPVSSHLEQTVALKRGENHHKLVNACGCENICVCMTPDSWKSVSGVIEERDDLLHNYANDIDLSDGDNVAVTWN